MRHDAAAAFRLIGALVLGLVFLEPDNARAQQAALRGIVTDTGGFPIADADIAIAARRQSAKTNSDGRFFFTRMYSGVVEISIRRLGYEPTKARVKLIEGRVEVIDVILVARPAVLEKIDVSDRARQRLGIEGFHQRRLQGLGTYVSREEIEKRNTASVSAILRTVPGIRFISIRGNSSAQGVRFNNTSIRQRDCMPMIWLDGQAAPGLEVDDIILPDVEGIELYNGPATTPMQFSQQQNANTCGTIVIWSRPPPSARPPPKQIAKPGDRSR
jgi:hypothetical protein